MIKSLEERLEALSYIYSPQCPRCGSKWDFELTHTGWKEIRRCDCEEYRKLIAQRWEEAFQSPDDRQFVLIQKSE